MARRFRTRSRRFKRSRREWIWVTGGIAGQDLNSSGTTSVEVLLAGKADWARDPSASGHLEKGCVLTRVVASVDIFYPPPGDDLPNMNDFALTQFYCWLRTKDEDDQSVMNVTTDAFDEQFLHFEGGLLERSGSQVPTITWNDRNHTHVRRHWDVRQKRKMTSEDQLVFGVAAGDFTAAFGAGIGPIESGQGLGYSIVYRALLQLP